MNVTTSRTVLAVLSALAGSFILIGAGTPANAMTSAAPTIHWGTAEQVPGLAAFDLGHDDWLGSVSCWRAGFCFAGGSYRDAGQDFQAFVVGEKNGHWATAQEVPGTAALNKGGNASISAVSCSPDGDCAAGGVFADAKGGRQVFVVSEKHGAWGRAEEIPGTAKLNIGSYAAVLDISCARGLNCSAVGFYQGYNPPSTGDNSFLPYVVTAKDGRWGKASQPPGLARLQPSQYPDSEATGISCPSPGNCTAGGFYTVYGNGSFTQPSFAATEKDGRWKGIQRPKGMSFGVVSCVSSGDCVAGGYGSVISQTNGRWGRPVRSPDVNAVSCSSPGNCAVAGSLGIDSEGNSNGAFSMTERYRHWRKPVDFGGAGGYTGQIGMLSCGTVGNCGAGGSYQTGNYDQNGYPLYGAFVVGERSGRWGVPELVPGLAAINPTGVASVNSVSCPAYYTCAAVGSYTDASGNNVAFVLGSQ